MEAVVKSLDPGSNADREAVLDTVTEIIALVVQTFVICPSFMCMPDIYPLAFRL